MDALSGVLPKAITHSRRDDFAVKIAQGQGTQGLRRADLQALSVGFTTIGDEHSAQKPAGTAAPMSTTS